VRDHGGGGALAASLLGARECHSGGCEHGPGDIRDWRSDGLGVRNQRSLDNGGSAIRASLGQGEGLGIQAGHNAGVRNRDRVRVRVSVIVPVRVVLVNSCGVRDRGSVDDGSNSVAAGDRLSDRNVVSRGDRRFSHNRSGNSYGVRDLDGCSAILLGESLRLSADASLDRPGDGDSVRNLDCSSAISLAQGLGLSDDAGNNWIRRSGHSHCVRNVDSQSAVPVSQGFRLNADAGNDGPSHSDSVRDLASVRRGQASGGCAVANGHSASLNVGAGDSLRSHDGPLGRW